MLAVREATKEDVSLIADYWLRSDHNYMRSLGVDLERLPSRDDFISMLSTQISLPLRERQAYALVWLLDDKPIGHCNINNIVFGMSAHMHLHIWNEENRKKRIGEELVKMSIPYFFNNYELKRVYCEPYAKNPAPHKLLEKLGFQLEKEYITTPGTICFEQPVKRWVLEHE